MPAAIDSLSEYAGVYSTVFLPAADGQAPRPIELTITSSKSGEFDSPPRWYTIPPGPLNPMHGGVLGVLAVMTEPSWNVYPCD